MKSNKDKCKVRHLGKHNCKHTYKLGNVPLGFSRAGKDMGVTVDHKLDTSQKCALVAHYGNGNIGKSREVLLHLCSALVKPPLDYFVQLWEPHFKKGTDKLESKREQQNG